MQQKNRYRPKHPLRRNRIRRIHGRRPSQPTNDLPNRRPRNHSLSSLFRDLLLMQRPFDPAAPTRRSALLTTGPTISHIHHHVQLHRQPALSARSLQRSTPLILAHPHHSTSINAKHHPTRPPHTQKHDDIHLILGDKRQRRPLGRGRSIIQPRPLARRRKSEQTRGRRKQLRVSDIPARAAKLHRAELRAGGIRMSARCVGWRFRDSVRGC